MVLTLQPDKIKVLLEETTVPSIAERFGTTPKTMYLFIRNNNISIPNRPEKGEIIVAEYGVDRLKQLGNKHSWEKMGNILGCSTTVLYKIFSKYKIKKRDMRSKEVYRV